MSAHIKTFLISFLFILLTSCGGGGGSADVAGEGSGSQQGGSSNGSGSDSGSGSGSGGGSGSGSDGPPSSGGDSSGGSGGDTPTVPGGSSGGDSSGGTPPSGGSSGGSGTPPASGGSSGGGSSGTPPTSGGGGSSGGGSTPPPTSNPVAFAASVTQAPADGATIRGTVRLLVEGSGIRNVELLPATGYAPLIMRGTVTGDGIGAYIDLDTTVLDDGELTVRIAAFNAPPGQGGSEIAAMPARTWIVENTGPVEPPTDTGGDVPALTMQEERAAACLRAGLRHTSLDDPEPVVCIQWIPPSPPIPPEQCTLGYDTPYSQPGDGLPVLRNGNRISKLYCIPEAMNGQINPGCLCRG